MSCEPINLQPVKAAVSAEIRNATACFPRAPDGGNGALFYLSKIIIFLINQFIIIIFKRKENAQFSNMDA